MPALPRRALPGLAGLAGLALTTTACDPFDTSAQVVPGPSKDELLVERIVAAVRRAQEVALAAGDAGLVAMHTAHLGALGASASASAPASGGTLPPATTTSATPPSSDATPPPAAGGPGVGGDLHAAESAVRATLSSGAAEAESGALARALASMSAAVAQHLAVLR